MEKEIRIDFVRCIKETFRRWYIIIGVAMVCFLAAYIATDHSENLFSANATVYSANYGSYQQSVEGLNAMKLYSEIINSRKVADRAAMFLGNNVVGEDLLSMVSSSYTQESAVLYIKAVSANPEFAVKVANAFADSFIIEAQNITGGDNVKLLDPAQYAVQNGMSKRKKYCLIATAVGLFIPTAIIVLAQIFSDKVYHIEDAELDGQLEVIGIIPTETRM